MVFKKLLCPCSTEESSLSIGSVKVISGQYGWVIIQIFAVYEEYGQVYCLKNLKSNLSVSLQQMKNLTPTITTIAIKIVLDLRFPLQCSPGSVHCGVECTGLSRSLEDDTRPCHQHCPPKPLISWPDSSGPALMRKLAR